MTTLLFFVLCATAQAENFSVQATNGNEFTPDELAVKPGDSVTFSNAGGLHNVVWVEGTFDDGSQASPADPAPTWPSDPVRTFGSEGTFSYYCEQHGTPSGAGMAGTVTVANTPPADTAPPAFSDVRAGFRKKRPFVVFTLSEPARVNARLFRRVPGPDKIRAEKNQDVEAVRRVISFGRRSLKKGRYYVAIRARDAAGNASAEVRGRFKVD